VIETFDPGIDLVIGLDARAGRELLAAEGVERLAIGDVARALDAFAQGRQIARRREEVVDDAHRSERIVRAQQDLARLSGCSRVGRMPKPSR